MNLFRFKEKEDEQVGVYYQTYDYSKFVLIEGNREINLRHVEGLKKSIQKIGLITPIQVDRNFKLGNGQHRFYACKDLGYPVTYQLLPDHIDLEKIMIDININNENWSNDDFCNRWAKKEQKENPESHMGMPYNIFQTCRNYKLHHKTLIILIYGSYKDAYSDLFRAGDLKIENKEQFRKDAEYLSSLMVAHGPRAVCEQRSFQVAMCGDFLNNENFDREKFLARVKKYPYKLEKRSSEKEYSEHIRDLYNWNIRKGKLV